MMAYYEDLSPYTYNEDASQNMLNVGWLDINRRFSCGQVSEEFVKRLWEYCKIPVMMMRGYHICNLCEDLPQECMKIRFCDETIKVGFSEIRVFANKDIIYAAPNLIFHYVTVHHYRPPDEFIDAVLKSDTPGAPEYRERLKRLIDDSIELYLEHGFDLVVDE